MSERVESPEPQEPSIGWKTSLLVCLVIAAVGAGLLYVIFNTEPTARRAAGSKSTAMLVDVITADTGTYRPLIEAMGTVEPNQEITLRPRVSGQIIARSAQFQPGEFVEKGHTLFRIDPADYNNTLQQRKSDLKQARSELKLEMGRQDVAQEEYQLLEENLTDENRALVLRRPQLESARAGVESARAAVDQARLNVERTSVEAPFDAQIINRNVNVGSQIGAGDNAARLVGVENYWIETTVPLSKLRWLTIPDTPGASGTRVQIRDRSAWSEGVHRVGHVDKLVGELEDNARMARVLITIEDPLVRETTTSDSPPLMIGAYVETKMRGERIRNVVRLKRDYLRDDDTVWVMQDGELDIRDVDVVFTNEEYAFIRRGLSEGERIVTTNLSTVVDGAPLRLQSNNSKETMSNAGESTRSDGSV